MAFKTGPTKKVSPKTLEMVSRVFVEEDHSQVIDLLINECGNNLPFLETNDEYQLERYRFAAIRMSGGRIDGLRKSIELAKKDWRDLLVVSGFAEDTGAHLRWKPDPSTDGTIV